MIRVVHPGSGYWFFTHPGSRIRIRNAGLHDTPEIWLLLANYPLLTLRLRGRYKVSMRQTMYWPSGCAPDIWPLRGQWPEHAVASPSRISWAAGQDCRRRCVPTLQQQTALKQGTSTCLWFESAFTQLTQAQDSRDLQWISAQPIEQQTSLSRRMVFLIRIRTHQGQLVPGENQAGAE